MDNYLKYLVFPEKSNQTTDSMQSVVQVIQYYFIFHPAELTIYNPLIIIRYA